MCRDGLGRLPWVLFECQARAHCSQLAVDASGATLWSNTLWTRRDWSLTCARGAALGQYPSSPVCPRQGEAQGQLCTLLRHRLGGMGLSSGNGLLARQKTGRWRWMGGWQHSIYLEVRTYLFEDTQTSLRCIAPPRWRPSFPVQQAEITVEEARTITLRCVPSSTAGKSGRRGQTRVPAARAHRIWQ